MTFRLFCFFLVERFPLKCTKFSTKKIDLRVQKQQSCSHTVMTRYVTYKLHCCTKKTLDFVSSSSNQQQQQQPTAAAHSSSPATTRGNRTKPYPSKTGANPNDKDTGCCLQPLSHLGPLAQALPGCVLHTPTEVSNERHNPWLPYSAQTTDCCPK